MDVLVLPSIVLYVIMNWALKKKWKVTEVINIAT